MTKPKKARKTARRKAIEDTLHDVVMDLMFYDRHEDSDLPVGAIEEAVKAGEITVEEMVAIFAKDLNDNFEDVEDGDSVPPL